MRSNDAQEKILVPKIKYLHVRQPMKIWSKIITLSPATSQKIKTMK
jgi:hypothetical protein